MRSLLCLKFSAQAWSAGTIAGVVIAVALGSTLLGLLLVGAARLLLFFFERKRNRKQFQITSPEAVHKLATVMMTNDVKADPEKGLKIPTP